MKQRMKDRSGKKNHAFSPADSDSMLRDPSKEYSRHSKYKESWKYDYLWDDPETQLDDEPRRD